MVDDELRRLLERFQAENAAAHVETRRYFDAKTEDLRGQYEVTAEGLRHEIRLVAESVTVLGEKVEREVNRLDEKMDSGFAETQAMIKFSHADLDRRITALEGGSPDSGESKRRSSK